jgi:hypothetical protein
MRAELESKFLAVGLSKSKMPFLLYLKKIALVDCALDFFFLK